MLCFIAIDRASRVEGRQHARACVNISTAPGLQRTTSAGIATPLYLNFSRVFRSTLALLYTWESQVGMLWTTIVGAICAAFYSNLEYNYTRKANSATPFIQCIFCLVKYFPGTSFIFNKYCDLPINIGEGDMKNRRKTCKRKFSNLFAVCHKQIANLRDKAYGTRWKIQYMNEHR